MDQIGFSSPVERSTAFDRGIVRKVAFFMEVSKTFSKNYEVENVSISTEREREVSMKGVRE